MTELKPCPNSECRGLALPRAVAAAFYVECAIPCGVRGPVGMTPDEASERWNALPREERWVPGSYNPEHPFDWRGATPTEFDWDACERNEDEEQGTAVDVLFDDGTAMARATFIWFYHDGPNACFVDDSRKAVNLTNGKKIVGWRPHTPPRGPEATDD